MLFGVLVEQKHVVAYDQAVPQDEKHVAAGRIVLPTKLKEVTQGLLRILFAEHLRRRHGRIVINPFARVPVFVQRLPDKFFTWLSPESVRHQVWDVRVIGGDPDLTLAAGSELFEDVD